MHRVLVLSLVLASACSGPATPAPAAPPTPPPAPVAAAEPPLPPAPDCTQPSRLCDLIALSVSAPADQLATTLYGDAGADILAKLRAKQLEPLIVDPGIVMRLDAALAFPSRAGETAWQFRARFAESLGSVRVYRGLAVTPDELASIQGKGILATSLRGAEPVPPYHLMDQLLGHLIGMAGPRDTMLSVSYDPAISRCVAAMYAGRGKDKTVHVWTIEMPLLDVLSNQVGSPLCPAVEPGTLDCAPPMHRITEATRRYACRLFYDPKIESFVQGRIDLAEMIEVKAEPERADCGDVLAATRNSMKARKQEQEKFCAPKSETVHPVSPKRASPPPAAN